MTPRKLHTQSLYLEPEKAALLDELASETRIPKAALLREAIDDLLTKHDKMNNAWYSDIVSVLRLGKTIAARYRSMSKELVWNSKCDEYRKAADELLTAMGKK